MAGFQPSNQRQIVSELAALRSRECGMKRRQTDTAAELDSRHDLLKAVKPEWRLDKAYLSKQQRLAGAAKHRATFQMRNAECRSLNANPDSRNSQAQKGGMEHGEL